MSRWQLFGWVLMAMFVLDPVPRAQEEPQESRTGDVAADDSAGEIVVTAQRHGAYVFDVPYSVSVLDGETLRSGPEARLLADTVQRETGVMVQRTGPGQSSPFIRGFTGFRTLLMVDGIRLNHSAFRDGPNQYFGTVDPYSIDRLELTRGPASVLWGSDAIGGALNALTGKAVAGDGWGGAYSLHYSSAERSTVHRLAFEGGEPGGWAAKGGVSSKHFGNIHAGQGTGNQPGTGFDERDLDLRLDVPLSARTDLTVVAQRTRQLDVPRTHKTVEAVSFHGTTVGSELKRDLTQERDLAYVRLGWTVAGTDTWHDQGAFTLSWQKHRETQDRTRTGGKFDTRGFDLRTLGAQLELRSDTPAGLWSWGLESFHDSVDSFRRDFKSGALSLSHIQGPVADDATYDLFGLYVQDEVEHGNWETTFGVRWSHAAADADRIDNPAVSGSDPATPGNIITLNEAWDAVVGSVRAVRHLDERTNLYVGLSQGFRAPNLSDLTADLTDSGAEQPTPNLDPEDYLAFELGVKTRQDGWSGELSVWNTWINDMIVQSPTGATLGDGTPIVQKDNVGDGSIWGIEGRVERDLGEGWTGFASATFMNGEVGQFILPAGTKVNRPISRLMPLTGLVGCTYEPAGERWWFGADVLAADKADRLALRDVTDTQRIPPGGTPGYAVVGLRGGVRVNERSDITVAVENLLDRDWRIHGSGLNEPGRSLVFTYHVRL